MSLEAYKTQIDNIDNAIFEKLEKRKIISKMIEKLKTKKGIIIDNSEIEKSILERLSSKKSILTKNDITEIYNKIFEISKYSHS